MRTLQRSGHIAYSHLPVYQKRRAYAEATIKRALSMSSLPYVGLSLGKDSSAMLWLVATQKPDIEVRIATCGETRYVHPELDILLEWWRGQFPLMTIHEVPYRLDENGDPLAPLDGAAGQMVGELTRFAPADCAFVGVRADESRARRMTILAHRDDKEWPIYTYKESASGDRAGIKRAYPLANWQTADVWGTLALHDIPVLQMYKHGEEERTTLRLCGESLSAGTISKLRELNPNAFHTLVSRYPELRRWA